MGSRDFKNILRLTEKSYGKERRKNLTKEELENSSPFPNPVVYEDIDAEMHRWVEEELAVSFEGKRLPTMDLFSNQRFSEYMQSWDFVDENNNLILNFKTVSRENNPKSGTINGETKNIPGDKTFLMKRVEAKDENNRKYFIEYRMKQPFSVDLVYNIGIMTNKYELINKFNTMVNEKFKAITAYIRPKGHFMSMILNDISDESEYNIDDRQFYSQLYNITVRAYIITEESFITEEKSELKFIGFEGETHPNKAIVEVQDVSQPCPNNPFYYQPIKINAYIAECCEKLKFNVDSNYILEYIKISQNVRGFKLFLNDFEINFEINVVKETDKEPGGIFYNFDEFEIGDKYAIINTETKNGDEIKICKLHRLISGIDSEFDFFGYDKAMICNKDDNFESDFEEEVEMMCEKE